MTPSTDMEHLPWALECVALLHGLTEGLCRERLDGMVAIYGEACHGRGA